MLDAVSTSNNGICTDQADLECIKFAPGSLAEDDVIETEVFQTDDGLEGALIASFSTRGNTTIASELDRVAMLELPFHDEVPGMTHPGQLLHVILVRFWSVIIQLRVQIHIVFLKNAKCTSHLVKFMG